MKTKFSGFLTLLLAFVVQISFAQEKTISGVVSDQNGLPLPGTTVLVQGTSSGSSTDFDGKYSIKTKEGDVLLFSFVGYTTKAVKVGGSSTINVTLSEDAEALEEVIVTGYGSTVAKATSTAAVVQLSSEGIVNRPNVNVLNSLEGQAAGVDISSFSGQPGTNKNDVVIRGVASLSASTDPLYVIDGVPLTQAFFRNLNPNEIESVSVLKDASATAVYGNRGSNGVIVITTKKGSYNQALKANYSTSFGYTDFIDDNYNLSTALEQLQLQRKGFDEGVGALASSFAVSGEYLDGAITLDPDNLEAYDVNTDWKEVFFRRGITSSHDLSLTAGGENLTNFTNVGYLEQDGIIDASDFKRFTVRNNLNGKSVNNKFNYSVNIFGAFSRRNQLEQETRGGINNNVLQNPLTGYLASSRFLPADLYESGAQLLEDFGNPALDLIPYMLIDLYQGNNAVSVFDEVKTIATFNASYKINDNLTFGITTGTDYAEDKRNFAIGPEAYLSVVRASGAGQDFNGIEVISSTREFMFNHINKLTYENTFNENHDLTVSLFTEYVKAHRRFNAQDQTGLNPLTWSPGAGTGYLPFTPGSSPASYLPGVVANRIDAGLFSYFSTLDYGYKTKYGLSATIRRDGSFRFVEDNKWGTFWSVAGRWNISEESFFDNVNAIDDLKLRASYGTTGNQFVIGRGVDSTTSDIFLGSQLVRDLNASATGFNNLPSFAVSSVANTDLRWETTAQFNVGLDFGMFNKRFTGSLEYYNRLTTDLFQNLPVSRANGIASISANDGSIRNEGVEFSGRYNIIRKSDFNLSVFGNIAYNNDQFETLGAIDPDGDGSFRPSDDFIRNVGGPLSEYFLVPYAGVNPANGNLLFLDTAGNITENPTDDDRRSTGKSLFPTYQGGFGLDLEYKGFFMNTLFSFVADVYRFDTNLNFAFDARQAGDFPVSADLFNAWTPDNRITDIPALAASNLDSQELSDRFLVDSSFLRLRNLTFGYNVPQQFLNKTFIQGLRFRVVAENYLTFTKWRGLDPARRAAGEATGFFPTPKILTFGLDVNF